VLTILIVSAMLAFCAALSFIAPVPSAAMRRKPVAVIFSMASALRFLCGCGTISSPASCSRTNWSKGLSLFSEPMT
jgi:hypothetical protein